MKKIYIIGLCCLLAVSGYSQTPTDTIKVSLQHTEDYGLVLDTVGFFPRNAADNFENQITSMYVDDDENIYVLGYMRERFSPEFKPSFTSYQLTSTQLSPRKAGGIPNIFIAKYDKNLQLIWVKSINSTAKLKSGSNSKLLIDKQKNTACFHFLYDDSDLKVEGDPFAPIYHENTKIMEFEDLGIIYHSIFGYVENRNTSVLLKFNMDDGSLVWVKNAPVFYSSNAMRFDIDNEGNIYMATPIGSELEYNVNCYPDEPKINFSVPENTGKPREEWVNNYIVVKYDKDMRYLSGFQIKDKNCRNIETIRVDTGENIYVIGQAMNNASSINLDIAQDASKSIVFKNTRGGFVAKYAHNGNNAYSLDWAKSKYQYENFCDGGFAFNEENMPVISYLVEADKENVYLFDEAMRPQNRFFKHLATVDMKFSGNELFVKKADAIPHYYSLPLEDDACIPEGMDYVSLANVQPPGTGQIVRYVYPFFLFSLDENNMLKWKLNKTSYSGIPILSEIYPNDFHITGNKRIYVTGEVQGKIDLDPTEPSRGLYFETDRWNVVGGGTSFLARYIETYSVKAGTEIQNGAILFDTNMVRNGGSCTLTVVPGNGYSLEAGSLSATNGTITPNADGTYTLSGVTKPAVVTANFVLPTGVAEMPAGNAVRIYPNPTKDELRVESGELRVENVEIWDVSGKKLSTSGVHISANSVNVSTLPKGMYFIQIQTDKGVVTEKFTKE